MSVEPATLQMGFDKLEQLAREEYGMSLQEILVDRERDEYDRLWRVGRLVGILLKEPFAIPQPQAPSRSETGAYRAWVLNEALFNLPENQQTWQYGILRTIATDEDLKKQTYLGPAGHIAQTIVEYPYYQNSQAITNLLRTFTSDEDMAAKIGDAIIRDYHAGRYRDPAALERFLEEQFIASVVRIAAQEMQSERGFFRCLALSAHKYLCLNERTREKLEESLKQSGGSNIFAAPQALIGAGSVTLANVLVDSIPWLTPEHLPILVGFNILIGTISLDGFCRWVSEYVREQEKHNTES